MAISVTSSIWNFDIRLRITEPNEITTQIRYSTLCSYTLNYLYYLLCTSLKYLRFWIISVSKPEHSMRRCVLHQTGISPRLQCFHNLRTDSRTSITVNVLKGTFRTLSGVSELRPCITKDKTVSTNGIPRVSTFPVLPPDPFHYQHQNNVCLYTFHVAA